MKIKLTDIDAQLRETPSLTGNANKVLTVNSAGTAIEWVEPSKVPAGGTTGQVLAKTSDADGDADWATLPEIIPDAPVNGAQYVRKNGNWVEATAIEDEGDGGVGKHRYWRLQAVNSAPAWQIRLQELVLTNEFDGLQKAVGGTALASTGVAANAFDSNNATTWTGGEGSGWIGYDFISPIQIVETRITVSGGGSNWGRPVTGDIQFSDDGENWVTAFPANTGWGSSLPEGYITATIKDPTYIPPYNSKVPVGGTIGQFLGKTSAVNGETAWQNLPAIIPEAPTDGKTYARNNNTWVAPNLVPIGGTTGQVLVKNSNTAGDVTWAAPTQAIPQTVVKSIVDPTYDMLSEDMGKYIRFTGVTEKVINVRSESIEALPEYGEWHFRNAGSEIATFVAGNDVMINTPSGGTMSFPPAGTVTLKRVDVNVFDLIGQTVGE